MSQRELRGDPRAVGRAEFAGTPGPAPNGEGRPGGSKPGPAQEIGADQDTETSTFDASLGMPRGSVKPLPVVEAVVEIDLSDLLEGDYQLADKARHRCYAALLGLDSTTHLRIKVGAARWWPPTVLNELAFWSRRARTVALIGSNAARAQRLAADLDIRRRAIQAREVA